MQKQSFTVHWGTDNTGDMLFMEVRNECINTREILVGTFQFCCISYWSTFHDGFISDNMPIYLLYQISFVA